MKEELSFDESDPIDEALKNVKILLNTNPPYRLSKLEIENVQSLIKEVSARLKTAEKFSFRDTDVLGLIEDDETSPSTAGPADEDELMNEIKPEQFKRTVRITDSPAGDDSDVEIIEVVEKDEAEHYKREIPRSINHVKYKKFISSEKSFLKMRSTTPFDSRVRDEQLKYPLGVVYDEVKKIWIVCEQSDKLIQIAERQSSNQSESAVLEHDYIVNPSALTILREGHTIAILCANDRKKHWITEYNHGSRGSGGKLKQIIHYKNKKLDLLYPCRGLARSYAGNILTIDHPPAPSSPRLRLFSKNGKGSASFDLQEARRPSFIASNETRVAISDLGTQRVFIYDLNDEKWKNGSKDFDIVPIHVIGEEHLDYARLPNKICDLPQFNFVAGIQFDKEGFLIVADAGGHTMKLFGRKYEYIHRISTDFAVPFMSSFHINRLGRAIIIDLRGQDKLCFAQLSSVQKILPWVETTTKPKPQEPSRFSNSGRSTSRSSRSHK